MEDPLTKLTWLERAALDAPADPAALGNLGIHLQRLGRLTEAEAVLVEALALEPDNAINRLAMGVTLLAQGRYAEAWPFYAARVEVPATGVSLPTKIKPPRWRGESIAGQRLLVMPEQGLGDQIQFARLLPDLAAMGGEIILASHEPLHRLFRTSFPDITHVVARRYSELPDADYWVSMIDVPALIDFAPEAAPQTPYIRTDAAWRDPPLGYKIGLMTVGNRRHPNDARRSLSPETTASLRTLLPGRIIDLDPAVTRAPGFAETAAIINAVDLVVSVDTAVAHLAGAMGKPCMLLLPGFDTDWRWGQGHTASAWYPQHTLFRCGIDGDWRPILDAVAAHAHEAAGG